MNNQFVKTAFFIFFLILVFVGGYYFASSKVRKELSVDFKARQELFFTRIKKQTNCELNSFQNTKVLSGRIVDVGDKKIELKINEIDPLGSPTLDVRIVVIDSDTEITTKELKTEVEYQQEADNYNQRITSIIDPADGFVPEPSAYKYKQLDFSSFEKGQKLIVNSNINIAKEKQFTADKIEILD